MKRRNRRWDSRKIMATSIAVFITLTLVITFVAGFTGSSNTTTDPEDIDFEPETLDTPAPQFPEPDSNVSIANAVIHSTGLFEVPLPAGDWAIFQQPIRQNDVLTSTDSNSYDPNRNRADLIINSGTRFAIVQAYLKLGVNYEDTQSLSDNLLTDSYFVNEWSTDYESWTITNRTIGPTFLTIDFELQDNELVYLGRQVSWQDQGNLFNLRFVVPFNNPGLLTALQKLYIEKFTYYPHIQTTPLVGWRAYSDTSQDMLIKVPQGWQTISGGIGRATTLSAPDDESIQVTIQQVPDVIVNSLEAAEAWIAEFRDDAEIIEGQAIEQVFANGYLYSYKYPTIDGDMINAAVAILNNHDGGINVAEIRATGADGSLLEAEASPTQTLTRQILDSFTVLAPSDYIYISQSEDNTPE
jgi:hypothetical protein